MPAAPVLRRSARKHRQFLSLQAAAMNPSKWHPSVSTKIYTKACLEGAHSRVLPAACVSP
jgi:hypothetical protein